MASTINFKNYVKNLRNSMRGAQRILFVGAGYNILTYPQLAGQAWKCIYTTSRDENFIDAFSLADRQVRPIYTKKEYDAQATKLDRNNPMCVFLNGGNMPEGEMDDIDLQIEREEDSRALKEAMSSLLRSDLLVELIVIGYNPLDPDEISTKEMYSLMRSLSETRITFFGISTEIEKDIYIKKLVDNKIATVFEQDLGSAFEEYEVDSFIDDEELILEVEPITDLKTSVYINNHIVQLDQNLCYDFNRYGRVLTVSELDTGTIGRSMQVDFFYNFLKKSPNSPQWYGYSARNKFYVTYSVRHSKKQINKINFW